MQKISLFPPHIIEDYRECTYKSPAFCPFNEVLGAFYQLFVTAAVSVLK